MVPERGLDATLAENMALPGNIALISQSGALCTSILDVSGYMKAELAFPLASI
jgi:acetyltransferase